MGIYCGICWPEIYKLVDGLVSSAHAYRGVQGFDVAPSAALRYYFKDGGVGSLTGFTKLTEAHIRPAALTAELRMQIRMAVLVSVSLHAIEHHQRKVGEVVEDEALMALPLQWAKLIVPGEKVPSDEYGYAQVMSDIERLCSYAHMDIGPASDYGRVVRFIDRLSQMEPMTVLDPPLRPGEEPDLSSQSSSSDDDDLPPRRRRAYKSRERMPARIQRQLQTLRNVSGRGFLKEGDKYDILPSYHHQSNPPPPLPKSSAEHSPAPAAVEKKGMKRPSSAPPRPAVAAKKAKGQDLEADDDEEEVVEIDDDRRPCSYVHKADKKKERGCPFYVAAGDRGKNCPIHKVIAAKQGTGSEKGKNLPAITPDQREWAEMYGTGRYPYSHQPGTSAEKVISDFVKWRDGQGGDGQGASTTPKPPSSSQGLLPSEMLVKQREQEASKRVKASAGAQVAPPHKGARASNPTSKGAGAPPPPSKGAGTSNPPPKGDGASNPSKAMAAIFQVGWKPPRPVQDPDSAALIEQLKKIQEEAKQKRIDEDAKFQEQLRELEEKAAAAEAAKAAKAAARKAAKEAERVLAAEEARQADIRAQMEALAAQLAASTEKKDKAAAKVTEEAFRDLSEEEGAEEGAEEAKEGEDNERTQSDKAAED